MKKKILILSGNEIGIKVFYFLKKKKSLDIEFCISHNILKKKYFNSFRTKKQFLNFLKKKKEIYDFIILVYWPWLIPKELFLKFKDSVNFHPSLLPIGRGWYPHVHAIIKNLKWGVSLHRISKGIDDGHLWCQKMIKFGPFSSSTDLYDIAKKKIFNLFTQNISKILNGTLKPYKQKGNPKIYKKSDIKKYDRLDLQKSYKLIDLIKISNARSFKGENFNYFTYNGKRFCLDIKVKKL